MMNENQTNNPLERKEGQEEWVFLPVSKKHIIKRTDTYVLIDVDGVASGIISAKFLRKKETEDMLFFSVPATYEIKCRIRELVNGKWVTKLEMVENALNLKPRIVAHNKD